MNFIQKENKGGPNLKPGSLLRVKQHTSTPGLGVKRPTVDDYPVGCEVLFSFVKNWYPAIVQSHEKGNCVLLQVLASDITKAKRLDNQRYKVHINRIRRPTEAIPPSPLDKFRTKKVKETCTADLNSSSKHKRKPETPTVPAQNIFKKRAPDRPARSNRNKDNRKNLLRESDAKKKSESCPRLAPRSAPNVRRVKSSHSHRKPEPEEEEEAPPPEIDHPFGDHPAVSQLEKAKRLEKEDPEAAIAIYRSVISQFQEAVYQVKNMNAKHKRRNYLAKLRRHLDSLQAGDAPAQLPDVQRKPSKRKKGSHSDEPLYFEKPKPKVKVSQPPGKKRRKASGANEQEQGFRDRVLEELVDRSPGVRFSDVQGLLLCKLALYEAVILPAINPHIFTGLRKPPKGILLFGPPGNGKTMIAKAVATECDATFFGVSASTITSKYVGDSERTMRTLFQIARERGPSIIFMDEVDSLLRSRGKSNELESSRRLKTEFLVQLDGIHTEDEDPEKRVLVIAATNMPQELDDAVLRRFNKRIIVPMPDQDARHHVIGKLLEGCKSNLANDDLETLVFQTEGYSCSDLAQLTSEAAMGPIRDVGLMATSITEASLAAIQYKHFADALNTVRPSVPKDTIKICEAWAEKYGSKTMLKIEDLPREMISSVERH